MDQALQAVGSILQSAIEESVNAAESRTEVLHLRWKSTELAQLRQICARHGTTPQTFLRAAARAVIAQYGEAQGDGRSRTTA